MNQYTVVGLLDGQRVAAWVEAENPEQAEDNVTQVDEDYEDLQVAGVFAGHLLALDS